MTKPTEPTVLVPETLMDGVSSIGMHEGLVRMSLHRVTAPPQEEGGEPTYDVCHQLAMTVPAFLRTYGMMSQVIKQMEENGLVKRRGDADGDGESAPIPEPVGETQGADMASYHVTSPNFPKK